MAKKIDKFFSRVAGIAIGILIIELTAFEAILDNGDATVALFTIPMAIMYITCGEVEIHASAEIRRIYYGYKDYRRSKNSDAFVSGAGRSDNKAF